MKSYRLNDALKSIEKGDFSVRLKAGRFSLPRSKKIAESFNRMASQLEANQLSNSNFISIFAHELKNPIASINGFAKLLKNDNPPPSQAEYLDIICEESQRLSSLAASILAISRIDRQAELTDISRVNITEQLRLTVASLYSRWAEKQLEIVMPEDDVFINADKNLLNQVWINLLDNAIKFSPENESIHLGITKNADSAAVSIKNYGCTLPKGDIPRVFDEFYQGEGAMKQSGNGLGLSVVKKITDLHGGNIQADIGDNGEFTITVVITNQGG